ncbi:MAG: hypothetical protein ACJAZP_001075 [Psychromonas sp.]
MLLAKFLSVRKKKNLSIELHPRASDAYHFFHSQPFIFDKANLGIDALEAIQHGQIFSVIHPSTEKCFLFSGFEILGFSISQFDIKQHIIIVHENLTDTEIEFTAWAGVIRTILSSIQESQLESFRKSFNESAPDFIIEKLFSSKKVTQKHLAECTSLSISGLKKQKKADVPELPEFVQNNVQSDIFEKLINEKNRN